MANNNVTVLTKPSIDQDSYVYDGSSKMVQLNGYDSGTMTVSGTQNSRSVGEYTLTFSLKDPDSYKWDDNTTDSFKVTWRIEKAVVSIPKLTSGNFTFDGKTHSPEVSGYNSQTMSVSGDTTATEAGNYRITYTLKDPNSYVWEDGTKENKDIYWSIKIQIITLNQLGIVKNYIDVKDSASIKAVESDGNTIKFYTTADKSGTAAIEIDLPEEMFLDQTKTTLVDEFAWSTDAYPSTEDPSLDGKPVLVLAVKGENTVNYSFIALDTIVKPYTGGTTNTVAVDVTDGVIKADVKVSAEEDNALIKKADGLYVALADKPAEIVYATNEEVQALFGSN